MDDVSFLSQKYLKRTLGKNNSHLLRRPGVGLSEAAGSVQSGTGVLQNFAQLDVQAVAKALEDDEVVKALRVLNTLDEAADHSPADVAAALDTLRAQICGNAGLEDALIKITVAASRLYLAGTHLLPLLAGLQDPAWWCENLPEGASKHKRVQAWRESPGDRKKMHKALGAMVAEKIEEAAAYGKNDAAALFGKQAARSSAVRGPSTVRGSSDSQPRTKTSKKKDKKDKKDKKEEGRKRKRHSSNSSGRSSRSSSTSEATRKKQEKARKRKEEERNQRKEKERKERQERKERKEKEESERKKKDSSASSREPSPAPKAEEGVFKVYRVNQVGKDGKAAVKATDLVDNLDVGAEETVNAAVQRLMTAQGSIDDFENWKIKQLQDDGAITPLVAEEALAKDVLRVVLVRKGG